MNFSQCKEIFIFISYGLILTFFSYKYMGYGHGIYVPMALFSSPLGYFGIRIAFLGTPILWGIIGYLLSKSDLLYFKICMFIMLIHYISFFILSLNFKNWNDWNNFTDTNLINILLKYLITGFVIYFVGQIYLWYKIIHNFRRLVN